MDESTFAVLLLVVGLGLMVAEVFLPSGGMIGILVLVCLVASIWCAWSAWWDSNQTAWWVYISSLMLLVPATISVAFYALPRTAMGRRVLLEAPDREEVTPYVKEQQQLLEQIGKTGKTVTLLNPGGMVIVNGHRFHCESEGMLLEAETEVRVVAVKGLRLVVRLPLPDDPRTRDRDIAEHDSRLEVEPPLDFDMS
ncbi:MAG: NfeD family protein [Planctomycetaceae bacterium]